jgi:hypothetical protein
VSLSVKPVEPRPTWVPPLPTSLIRSWPDVLGVVVRTHAAAW